jgi:hypothetical protein
MTTTNLRSRGRSVNLVDVTDPPSNEPNKRPKRDKQGIPNSSQESSFPESTSDDPPAHRRVARPRNPNSLASSLLDDSTRLNAGQGVREFPFRTAVACYF